MLHFLSFLAFDFKIINQCRKKCPPQRLVTKKHKTVHVTLKAYRLVPTTNIELIEMLVTIELHVSRKQCFSFKTTDIFWFDKFAGHGVAMQC